MWITIAGYCWLCRQPLHYDTKGICSSCIRHLPTQRNRCPCCLYPSSHSMILCGRCLQSPLHETDVDSHRLSTSTK